MVGELPGGQGFVVRLPSQLIFRQPLKKPPCDGCLYFKLCEHRFCNRHVDSPFLPKFNSCGLERKLNRNPSACYCFFPPPAANDPCASAAFRTRSLIDPHPPVTPFLWSSRIKPSAV